MFRWNETEVNTNVSTPCFYGPPNEMVTRFCVSRGNLTAPSIERCRTVISTRYTIIANVSDMQTCDRQTRPSECNQTLSDTQTNE